MSLIDIDKSLFHFINQDLVNPVFDWLMPMIRNKNTWIPLYIILGIILLKNNKWIGKYIIGGAILSVVLSDMISGNFLKDIIQRPRPCADPDFLSQVHLMIKCSNGFSFPSAHASNHMALAVFLGFAFRKLQKPMMFTWLILWAISISFAQVYVGVHYPSDVTGGMIIGALIGYATYVGWNNISHRIQERFQK